MDLLKPEDLERNSNVIIAGYGLQYEGDSRGVKRPLVFTRSNMYMEEGKDLNLTIFFKNPYIKTCKGMS